ncbi:large ribosomal subunit protein mL42 [Salarias fasciatus]|uniref:Large ribosomal subunit protein mL42 n=1 Tax=Salarias fasciatus TaxID=181472 RepID=A0A672FUZ1_SALFA|nr:39S ribosomal protein L42, mitochondrial [Salarias fasciatus]
MASGRLFNLHGVLYQLRNISKQRCLQSCLLPVRQKTGGHLLDLNCNVEIGVTSDGKTIVCYHPAADIPYELTQPIERPDPVNDAAETHDQVLKAHLSKDVLKNNLGPTEEELGKMFYTTKHQFYPKGQYHMRRINKNPPKDR